MNEGLQQENLFQLMTKVQAERIRRAFVFFRENGIEPILIKGWAIARFYPNESERYFSDTDLAVNPTDYSKAADILTIDLKGQLVVDLHDGLQQFDNLPFEDLFENSELVEFKDIKVRVLRHEDHLRILAVHWLRDGGTPKHRLWDVHYGLANRPKDFDWDRFLGTVSKKRRKWIVAAIALAHRYTNLNVDDTPIAEEVKNPLLIPKWVKRTLEKEWNDGVKIVPINMVTHDRRELWQQLRKRFPPNPLVASMYTDAPLNNFPRLPFQIINIFQRLKPSIRRNKALIRFK
jgi:hypothetical protein